MCLLFPRDDPWYLVSKPVNSTKLRDFSTALNTTSRGWCRCHLAAFRNGVCFETIGVAVAHVTKGDVRIIWHDPYQSEDERYNVSKISNLYEQVEPPSRWPRRQAWRKYELYYANLLRKRTASDMPPWGKACVLKASGRKNMFVCVFLHLLHSKLLWWIRHQGSLHYWIFSWADTTVVRYCTKYEYVFVFPCLLLSGVLLCCCCCLLMLFVIMCGMAKSVPVVHCIWYQCYLSLIQTRFFFNVTLGSTVAFSAAIVLRIIRIIHREGITGMPGAGAGVRPPWRSPSCIYMTWYSMTIAVLMYFIYLDA